VRFCEYKANVGSNTGIEAMRYRTQVLDCDEQPADA